MKLTLEELYLGNETEIGDVKFKSTKTYVEPFINKVKPFVNHIEINASYPGQLVKTEDKNAITFNKVHIKCYVKSESDSDLKEIIVFSYTLEGKTPLSKIYRGYESKDGHFVVDNPNWIIVQKIEEDGGIDVSKITSLLEDTSNMKTFQDKLNKVITKDQITKSVGNWITYCMITVQEHDLYKTKLPYRHAINGYKSLTQNTDSGYYMIADSTYVHSVYYAMLQIITDDTKDIMNVFDKTILVNNMLGL